MKTNFKMYRTNHPGAPGPYTNSLHRRHHSNVMEQLKASWLTALIGCAVFPAGMWLLFWNEGQDVQFARSLEEAMNAVVPLQNTAVVLEGNNGKLIHFSGPLEIGEPLSEPEYGVSVPAVKLKRRVQMYQWVEEEHSRFITLAIITLLFNPMLRVMSAAVLLLPLHWMASLKRKLSPISLAKESVQLSGFCTETAQHRETEPGDQEVMETSYSYSMEWRDKLIDSSVFYTIVGHHNPKKFPLKTTVYMSEHVNVGSYIFGKALKEKFNDFVLVTSDERPERRDIKLHAGLYYHSQDVWNPEVGDIRVQFSYAGKAGDVVSVVGMQVGREIHPYKTSSGDEILMLRHGRATVQEMFMEERARNRLLTWTYRGLGWLLMFLGATCLSSILQLMVSRYSVLHDLLTFGVGSINLALSTSVCMLTMAFAWVWYRPILGGCLVAGAVVPFICSVVRLYHSDSRENRYHRL